MTLSVDVAAAAVTLAVEALDVDSRPPEADPPLRFLDKLEQIRKLVSDPDVDSNEAFVVLAYMIANTLSVCADEMRITPRELWQSIALSLAEHQARQNGDST